MYKLPFSFNFPEIKAAKAGAENTIDKLREEVDELDEAQRDFIRAVESNDREAIDRALEHVLEESLDVLHAAETQLRKFAPTDIFEMRNFVIEKNDARGYYDDDVETQAERPAGWISVAEKLPEEGRQVYLHIPAREGCNQQGNYVGYYKPGAIKGDPKGEKNVWSAPVEPSDWNIFGWSYFENPVVTHWHELPEFN